MLRWFLGVPVVRGAPVSLADLWRKHGARSDTLAVIGVCAGSAALGWYKQLAWCGRLVYRSTLYLLHQLFFSYSLWWRLGTMLKYTYVLVVAFLNADMEDLKASQRFLVLQKPMIWHTETLIFRVNDCRNQNTMLMRFFLYRNRLQY